MPSSRPVQPDPLRDAIVAVPDYPKPGILFRDITPVLATPALFTDAVERLVASFAGAGVTHVVGIEARGFWFGPAVAERLGAGFVPARKPGKLPRRTLRVEYDLEYGRDAIEIHSDAFRGFDRPRVLVHDDVIATGGTASAAGRLVREAGCQLVGLSFLVEIAALEGRAALESHHPGIPCDCVVRF
jgi:adenine phosphoribosyltransferase